MADLYADLGLNPDATDKDIKQAYRKAAKEHHPDRDGEAEDFHRVSNAYQILKDPRRRDIYDRTGDPNAELPDEKRLAAQMLVQLFDSILINHKRDIIFIDVVAEMKKTLRDNMKANFESRRVSQETIDYVKDIQARVGCEGENDFISAHLEGIIKSNYTRIQKDETDIRVGVEARRLLREYTFKTKERPAPALPPQYGSATMQHY